MRERQEEVMTGNLTAMIDVVFQLIIFFVCTVNMSESGMDMRIRLAMAPHSEEVRTKDPLEINIDVDSRGVISIVRTPMSKPMLMSILKKAVGEYGGGRVPVIIRADGKAKHEAVKVVMDACSESGIWKLKFAALKESAH